MRILHLTLKRKWFDMILSGEKKEEYREIKPYWTKRLLKKPGEKSIIYREFDIVRFRNGYSKNAPTMDVECEYVDTSLGHEVWGAKPRVYYYVIKLGDIVISNI